MAAITALTLSPGDFKVRWREPYVSEALNRKFAGIVPRGIYSGFALATHAAPLTVKLVANASSAHVAVYESLTAYSLTINRSGGDIVINMAAFVGQTVYVVLYAVYSPVTTTVAEIRLYSEADYNAAPEKPELVVFGTVNVPGAGVIPASAVSVSKQTLPWKQVTGAAVRPWLQIVKNGSFDESDGNALPGVLQTIPGFTGETTGAATIAANGTNPRSGTSALEIAIPNVVSTAKIGPGQYSSANPLDGGVVPVRAGQAIDVAFWLSGVTVGAYTDGTKGLRLIGTFYNAADVLQSTVQVASDASIHVGTFPYTQLVGTFLAPVAGYFVWYMEAAVDLGAGPSTFYVADLRMFLQPQASVVDDEGAAIGEVSLPVLRGMGLDLVPTGALSRIAQSAVARVTSVISPALDLVLSLSKAGNKQTINVPRWDTPFIHENLIADPTGFGLSGTAIAADQELPATTFKLLHTYKSKHFATTVYSRVYSSTQNSGSFVFTTNAWWDGAASLWKSDSAGVPASRVTLDSFGLRVWSHVAAVSWADGAWIRGDVYAKDVNLTGLLATALSITANSGNITAVLGDVIAAAGNISAPLGNALAANFYYPGVVPSFSTATEMQLTGGVPIYGYALPDFDDTTGYLYATLANSAVMFQVTKPDQATLDTIRLAHRNVGTFVGRQLYVFEKTGFAYPFNPPSLTWTTLIANALDPSSGSQRRVLGVGYTFSPAVSQLFIAIYLLKVGDEIRSLRLEWSDPGPRNL